MTDFRRLFKETFEITEVDYTNLPKKIQPFPSDLRATIDPNNNELHKNKTYNLEIEFPEIEAIIDNNSPHYGNYPTTHSHLSYTRKEAEERIKGLDALRFSLSPFTSGIRGVKYFSAVYKRLELETEFLKRELRDRDRTVIPVFTIKIYRNMMSFKTPMRDKTSFDAVLNKVRAHFSSHHHDMVEKVIAEREKQLLRRWLEGSVSEEKIYDSLVAECKSKIEATNSESPETGQLLIRLWSKVHKGTPDDAIKHDPDYLTLTKSFRHDEITEKWFQQSKQFCLYHVKAANDLFEKSLMAIYKENLRLDQEKTDNDVTELT